MIKQSATYIMYYICSEDKQIKDENKSYTKVYNGAIYSGYMTCKKCFYCVLDYTINCINKSLKNHL